MYPIDDELSDLIRTFIQRSVAVLNRENINENIKYALLPWGESIYQKLPSFYELHQLSSVSVCATEIVKGLSMAMDMNVPHVEFVTADIDTDLINKCDAVIDQIGRNDFVLLHINGADEASHRGDINEKNKFYQTYRSESDRTAIRANSERNKYHDHIRPQYIY